MPSVTRAILLAVRASSFLALTGLYPTTLNALASPLPMPFHASPIASPISLLAARVVSKHTDSEFAIRALSIPPTVPAPSPLQQRQSTDAAVERFRTSSVKAGHDAETLGRLAAEARSGHPGDVEFQQQCTSALSSYRTNFASLQSNLFEITSDKGLAYYDHLDDVETLLKNVVNFHKNVLSDVTALIYQLPILGPILGPIVYDIKCLVDEILNAAEDLTDFVLNLLAPLLQALGLSAVTDLLCSLSLCLL
ncbi:hypothetical protein B0H15DRAFT_217330 [Mycena belliarum]|uniref:Uncharacterized protein n=1 Tax=Mycena belliarum TaxID=1033014 RepID=A0AAD6XUF8_9AGAR|nr:hypothetical protein B0H15DRAFT_217330 [Mycena belliae]